jgi:transcriptional regulator with XRE-family HTH domain
MVEIAKSEWSHSGNEKRNFCYQFGVVMPEKRDRTFRTCPDAIKPLMVRKGFDDERLAQAAEVSVNTVRKALKGEEGLLLSKVEEIAKALGVTPDSILVGYQPPAQIEPPALQDFEFMVRFRGTAPAGVDVREHFCKVDGKIVNMLE